MNPTTRRRMTRGMLFLAVGCALVAMAQYLGRHWTLDELAAHEVEWRDTIHRRFWLSIPLGVLLYTTASLVPGTSGKSIVVGWLFGLPAGLIVVMSGLMNAALVSFLTGRHLLRDFIEARIPTTVLWINDALEKDGPFYLVTLRMAHVSYTLLNYACSVSRLRPRTFAWTTFVGLLPSSALLVWFGSTLPTLHELARHGLWSLFDVSMIAAFAVLAALPVMTRGAVRLIRALIRRLRKRAPGSPDSPPCQPTS